MLIEERSIKEVLSGLVRDMVWNPAWQEDLLQEALIHLWLRESRRPGQTRSWYLQSCRFHLQHYLASGRSVDSQKRQNLQVNLSPGEDESIDARDYCDTDTCFLAQICARELISLLSHQLKPRAQAILKCLADGMGAREIARELHLSHPTVSKYRCEIARLVLKLGIARPINCRTSSRDGARPRNGVKHPDMANQTLVPDEARPESTTVPAP